MITVTCLKDAVEILSTINFIHKSKSDDDKSHLTVTKMK